MNSFERLSNNCFYSQKIRAFSSPVSGWSWTVLLTCKNDQLMSFLSISKSSITDVENFPSRNISGLRSNLRRQFVDDSCVGKSSSGHNLIVASSCTVSVEIRLLNSFSQKISSSWGIFSNVSSRWNVVSCNWISETT